MANIVLLNPLGYKKGFFPRHCHFLRDWSGAEVPAYIIYPPLDLMYAAAYLRRKGCAVKIIDANPYHFRHSKIVSMLKEIKPDFALIPSAWESIEDDIALSKLIRKDLPETKIIFSGPNVTYNPSSVLLNSAADFVALGELELPLAGIVKNDFLQNIAIQEKGSVRIGERILMHDLDTLPFPARDLVDNKKYQYAFAKRNPVTAMAISRGCPHSKCAFCHANLWSLNQIRYRSAKNVLEEIKEVVYKFKIPEIFFRDQTFTANRNLVMEICEEILKNNIDVYWRASTRVDLVDKELLMLMHRAGCHQISFGFESSSQRVLDINFKGITLEQSRIAAKLARDAGMEVSGLFMFGMQGDTEASLKNLYRFALELKVEHPQFNIAFRIPGTVFHERFLNLSQDINNEKRFYDYSSIFPKWILKRYLRNAYWKFYFRPSFILRQFKKINNMNKLMLLIKTGIDVFLYPF
jgi:radical SAM superfamily enzyme YgiQ (UPF0313 family)